MQSYTEQLQQTFAVPQRIFFGGDPLAMIEYDVTAQMVKKLRGIYTSILVVVLQTFIPHFVTSEAFHPTECIEHFLFFLDGFFDEDDIIARLQFRPFRFGQH